jgi:hypothetical protein
MRRSPARAGGVYLIALFSLLTARRELEAGEGLITKYTEGAVGKWGTAPSTVAGPMGVHIDGSIEGGLECL